MTTVGGEGVATLQHPQDLASLPSLALILLKPSRLLPLTSEQQDEPQAGECSEFCSMERVSSGNWSETHQMYLIKAPAQMWAGKNFYFEQQSSQQRAQ